MEIESIDFFKKFFCEVIEKDGSMRQRSDNLGCGKFGRVLNKIERENGGLV